MDDEGAMDDERTVGTEGSVGSVGTEDGTGTAPRVWWLAGAVVTTVVAAVFTFWGDGVPPVASGRLGAVVDHGHAGAWVLLALAAWVATVTGRWTRVSAACAAAALVLYLVFLAALFA